jgi:hypothetical protein
MFSAALEKPSRPTYCLKATNSQFPEHLRRMTTYQQTMALLKEVEGHASDWFTHSTTGRCVSPPPPVSCVGR